MVILLLVYIFSDKKLFNFTKKVKISMFWLVIALNIKIFLVYGVSYGAVDILLTAITVKTKSFVYFPLPWQQKRK